MIDINDISRCSYYNKVNMRGIIKEVKQGDAVFDKYVLATKRRSGKEDEINLLLPTRFFREFEKLQVGCCIDMVGRIYTFDVNVHEKEDKLKSKLVISVLCEHPNKLEISEYPYSVYSSVNEVALIGNLTKDPVVRETHLGRVIADDVIAVYDKFKDDTCYVPFISWGRNADFLGECKKSDKVALIGRLQSREYEKTLPNGEVETRTAYELSASYIEKVR